MTASAVGLLMLCFGLLVLSRYGDPDVNMYSLDVYESHCSYGRRVFKWLRHTFQASTESYLLKTNIRKLQCELTPRADMQKN